MDESGFTTVQNPGKVISTKGKKQVGATTSQERGELTTLACTVNALGNSLPPFYIFKRVRWNDCFLNGAPAGSTGTASKSAWMTIQIFVEFYLPFVIKHTRCSKEKPILLILDNHCSHISLESVTLAKDSGVVLLTLPPHTSHRLQPLDRTVFGPMKTYFNRAMDNFMRTHPKRSINIYDIGGLTERAFAQSMTVGNITSGFRSTGIYPFNTDIFTDADYVPADVTDRPQTVVNEPNDLVNAQPSTSQSTSLEPSTPSTSRVVATPKEPVTPQDILPLPKAPPRKDGAPRRKRVKTAILTDTPEKKRIEQERADKLNKTKKKPKRKVIQRPIESSSEEEDDIGMIIATDSDSPSEAEEVEPVSNEVVEGAFVVVKYDGRRSTIGYVGMVVGKEEGDWRVDFYKKNPQGTFNKPSQPDISLVEAEQIVCVLGAPASTGTTVRTLGCVSFGNKLDTIGYELR